MEIAQRRLMQLQSTLGNVREFSSTEGSFLLFLPDDSGVHVSKLADGTSVIIIQGKKVINIQLLEIHASIILSAVGTGFENQEDLTRKYAVLKLTGSDDSCISISDIWASIYALWTLYRDQEYIPTILESSIPNHDEIIEYILLSGLGRVRLAYQKVPDAERNIIFLVRETFWQGAGTGSQWDNYRGWLRGSYMERISKFPHTQSFTRNPLVITAHPLRPPKPRHGECIYKRYCVSLKKMISFHVFDPNDDLHVESFHRWHNDERVHLGWGKRGSIDEHRELIKQKIEDPHIISIIMCWDGEFMGYAEFTWTKEDHIAAYISNGPLDYDRGLHVLCGNTKFSGPEFSQAWSRSLMHYIFLADTRTIRIIAGPRRTNSAIMNVASSSGMHLQKTFDFPYMRAGMIVNLRERFFRDDMLQ